MRYHVSFEERDIAKNPELIKDIEKQSHQRGVPMIEIGDEIFVGFDRPVVARALGIKE